VSEALRASLRTALRLAAFTAGTAALLAAVHLATREPITAEQRRADREALAALLPESGYDNDPVADTILLRAPDGFGDDRPRPVRRATLHGEPAAAVLSVVAPDGYGGPIELLLGVRADGTVIGVRVVAHNETPGLGDPIEDARSDWIHRLAGRALGDPPPERWAVRRDGGDFDQFAGATITPRAVVAAVRRALTWFGDNKDRVFGEDVSSSARASGEAGTVAALRRPGERQRE
jgi:electron transport complex protein RnfG